MSIDQLRQYWQANRARLDRLEQQTREGMQIGDTALEQARRQVELDERAAAGYEQAYKDREAAGVAARAEMQQRREQAAQQEEAAYRAQIASIWQGDQASLEAAFPQMWQQELSRRAQEYLTSTAPRIKL
jgi:hypothetical protein